MLRRAFLDVLLLCRADAASAVPTVDAIGRSVFNAVVCGRALSGPQRDTLIAGVGSLQP